MYNLRYLQSPTMVPDPARVIGYARFRNTPEITARYSLHEPGRWYPVLNQMNAASDLVSPGGMVWLDMGLIRGVPLEDVEVRSEPDQS
jgi:hypothetical protein